MCRSSALALTLALLGGCKFDSRGVLLKPHDAAPGEPSVGVDQRLERQPDLAADRGADGRPDQQCQAVATGTFCIMGAAGAGQVGICEKGKYRPGRYCYSEAPCDQAARRCKPGSGAQSCWSNAGCAATQICTDFVEGSYCVTPGQPGGAPGASCAADTDCKSGFCVEGGTCLEICDSLNGKCATPKLCLPLSKPLPEGALTPKHCKLPPADAGVADLPKSVH